MLFVSTQPGVHVDPQALSAFVLEKILEPPARPRAVSVIAEMPVTPIGKIFKPKLREIAAAEAARELLAAEGLAKDVSVEAITDPSRGLFLRIKAPSDKAVAAQRLLQKFPVKIELDLRREPRLQRRMQCELGVKRHAGLADQRGSFHFGGVTGVATGKAAGDLAPTEQRPHADGFGVLVGGQFAAPFAAIGGVGAGVVKMRVAAGDLAVDQNDNAGGMATPAVPHVDLN
jgi:hypothetical protein